MPITATAANPRWLARHLARNAAPSGGRRHRAVSHAALPIPQWRPIVDALRWRCWETRRGTRAAAAGLALDANVTIRRYRTNGKVDNPTYFAKRERFYEGMRFVPPKAASWRPPSGSNHPEDGALPGCRSIADTGLRTHFQSSGSHGVLGERKMPLPGQKRPTEADVLASQEIAMAAPRTAPKGVYRYRSHEEANRDAERRAIDAMVERNLELANGSRDRAIRS